MVWRLSKLLKAGQRSDAWPALLLVTAFLIPTAALIWGVSNAMRNEVLVLEQELAKARRTQLITAREHFNENWHKRLQALQEIIEEKPPQSAFRACLDLPWIESAVILGPRGEIAYPNLPEPNNVRVTDPRWRQANQLESVNLDFTNAAKAYGEIRARSSQAAIRIRASQAEARCLLSARQTNEAVRIAEVILAEPDMESGVDGQGRLIWPNAALLLLDLGPSALVKTQIVHRLATRLLDYSSQNLAASQRRFLMNELVRMHPATSFPTLRAEWLAAREAARAPLPSPRAALISAPEKLWACSAGARAMILFEESKFEESLRPWLAEEARVTGCEFRVQTLPTSQTESALSIPLDPFFPEWILQMSVLDSAGRNLAEKRNTALYVWGGFATFAVMILFGFMAFRSLRKDAELAKLKNDLVATVSHELKTPLASMRVLVDTLLDAESNDPARVKDYLKMISAENERLSSIIENFLTFSRLEKRKYRFSFSECSVNSLVEDAGAMFKKRFPITEEEFQIVASPVDGIVEGDQVALGTMLLNILENAWKYSEAPRRIVLRATRQEQCMTIGIEDNGIGIPPEEQSRIYQQFHQVDNRLSRVGNGCGLGLSIVQLIIAEHRGEITLQSEPGKGSVFEVRLPLRTQKGEQA